jgi:outer membrane lipopolysaccharide assembly protein LptE/RlpB
VLAREAEETKLLKEMQCDAVQQVMRRLQSAKKPA